MNLYREESDSIGKKQVPINAYYGVQTLRAKENFKIIEDKVSKELIKGLVEIKLACALANKKAKTLNENTADAIVWACNEIIKGDYEKEFIVSAVQGGAGTSANMNANEVIANLATEKLGGKKGEYIVHPNDHVNCAQSTNDVFPSAGKIALVRMLTDLKFKVLTLIDAFKVKSNENKDVIKMGRTEMQDAVPISFYQVFTAYASALSRDAKRLDLSIEEMQKLNLGGTAIGTSINATQEYVCSVVDILKQVTNLNLSQAEDLVDATQNLDGFVFVSGSLKALAVTLSKIANDLRLMSSGPRTGFAEISLKPMQNGSSIMPGKINPVIPEAISQIAYEVIGNDTTITLSCEAGQLELNAFEPIIFRQLFESIKMLTNGIETFKTECIEPLEVNRENCNKEVQESIGIVTALCPKMGYKKCSEIAKKALKEKKLVKDVIIEEGILSKEDLEKYLNPKDMI